MGSLNNIVNVQISRQTSVPSRAGFGTGAFLSEDTTITDPSKRYSSLSEMQADAAVGADSLLAGAAYFGQQFAPPNLTIIKEISAQAQVSRLTFSEELVTDNSTIITIDGVAGTAEVFASDHDTTMTAIAGQIGSDFAQVTAAVIGGAGSLVIEITAAVADTPFSASGVVTLGVSQPTIAFSAVTTAGGLTESIQAAIDFDNDWYALGIFSRVLADQEEVSDYIQGIGSTNPKLFFAQSGDTAIIDAGSSADIASILTAKSNFRTAVWYHEIATEYLDMGILGGQLPTLPGSITWAYKSVSLVTVSNLSDGQKTAAHGKNANTYDLVASVNITEEGKVCDGGNGEYIDVIRGVDWIKVNMSADIFTLLVNAPKVPYSTAGIAQIQGILITVLSTAQTQGILTIDQTPVVSVPDVGDVSAADKASRTLNDVTFSGVLAGAIQKINVQGTVTLV